MITNMFLEGKKIYLRALTENDIYGNYKYWFNDEEVCKGNSHHRYPIDEDSLKDYIIKANKSTRKIVLAIIDKKTEEHIGNVSLQNINYISRSAEFAIIIGERKFWGKSYGKEAATLIIEHGFNSINLNKVYCGTYSTNTGMRSLTNSLNFTEEGILRESDFKEGSYVDIIQYGLLKKEWEINKK